MVTNGKHSIIPLVMQSVRILIEAIFWVYLVVHIKFIRSMQFLKSYRFELLLRVSA